MNTIQQALQNLLTFTEQEFAASPSSLGPRTANYLADLTAKPILPASNSTQVPLANSVNAIADEQLRQTLQLLLPRLAWVTTGDFTTSDRIDRAYFELIGGPDALIQHPDFRMGLYWQEANSLYPSHRHNALELYYILSGTALWQRGKGEYKPQPPGQSFDHLDRLDHSTKTTSEDLLALWAWHGDITWDSYSMDTA